MSDKCITPPPAPSPEGWRLGTVPPMPPRRPHLGKGSKWEFSDLGNSQRFVYRYGRDVRYVPQWKQWLVWDGACWRPDERGQVQRWVVETVLAIGTEEVPACQKKKDADWAAEWVLRSQHVARLGAMLELARTAPRMAVMPHELDTDPWLLGAPNGTVDLRTGKLREARREDLITKITAVPFDPDAKAPLLEETLALIQPDPEMRDFLRRAAGYTLTGSTREQVLFLTYGPGQNGKSTILNVLSHCMGDMAASASSGTILARREGQHPEDLARLAGARLVTSIEVEEERKMSEALVKSVTGGDAVTARFMRGNSFEFTPRFKLWLAVNHLPVVQGGDLGIWRRLVTIPFEHTIERRDLDMGDKLKGEAAGILAWAVRGCLEYQRRGLDEPAAVLNSKLAYRESMDSVGRFLEEVTTPEPGGYVTMKTLYEVATKWWKEEGLRIPAAQTLGSRLTDKGIPIAIRWINGRTTRIREGIAIRPEWLKALNEPGERAA